MVKFDIKGAFIFTTAFHLNKIGDFAEIITTVDGSISRFNCSCDLSDSGVTYC